MEKTLPQNIEAEEGVLGSIIIDPEAVVQVADFLRPDDFYREAHRAIFQAVLDLYAERGPADLITLCDELERRGRLEEIGGQAFIATLVNAVPTSANVEYYARIVERTAIMRRLIHAAGQIAALAYNEADATEALDKAEQLIFAVSQRYSRSDFDDMRTLLDEYYEKLDKLHEQRGALVGLPTGFIDLDKMTGGLQKSDLIILAARPAVGKCLTAGTLIDDPATGERLTIEECVQRRQATVYGLSTAGKIRPTPVSDWIDNGVQACYRMRTATGRVVEVTATHPFLTVHGWKPLNDLQAGSSIAIPRAVPAFGHDESWPLDLVRLLAYYIAEGGLTDTSPEFTNTDPVIVSDFKDIIGRRFPECAIRHDHMTYIVARSRKAQLKRVAIMPPNPVTEWLKDLGLWGKLAKDKSFPDDVWKWSKRYLAELLRALMSCDGSIYALSQCPDLPRIEFTVASPQLAADVHHALTRFGILAKHCETKYGAYRVEVTSPDAVRLYQEQIGWIGEKTQRFTGLVRVIPARLSNRGHPPKETWELVRVAARQQGLSMIEIARRSGETTATGHLAGYNPHMGRSLPSYRLAAYAAVLNNPQLLTIASPDIYWDTIASIESIGAQHVYDLTIPDGANFVAQDILVHNSALALSLAYNTALRHKSRVAFFALEMSKEQLVQRLLSMDSNIDQQRLRTGMIEEDEWERISHSMGKLSQLEIYIDDTAGISTMEMRSKARRLAAERGVDLVIVDYLQLMQGHSGGRNENRVQEISDISRSLKALARELNVPVLALSQLSRAVESRQSRVPQLSDLRESGSIEQDADIVLFIYRDEVYNPESDRKNIADIIVAKHRNGPIGQFSLYFKTSQTLFRNLDLHGPQP